MKSVPLLKNWMAGAFMKMHGLGQAVEEASQEFSKYLLLHTVSLLFVAWA